MKSFSELDAKFDCYISSITFQSTKEEEQL